MTRRPLPRGWWFIFGVTIGASACVGSAFLMASLTALAQGWGAMP